jgi:predicted phosphodiesterase
VRVAVFSDVHANLPALEVFVRKTRGEVDGYLCLGDVVNYGPWNDECLELVHSLPLVAYIEGNHELLFRSGDWSSELPLVQEFSAWSRSYFTRGDLIEGLPQSHSMAAFRFAHTVDGRRIYANTPVEIDAPHFIGHSHHQFDVMRSGHRLVNCGSVGQNRGEIDVLNYALFDSTTGAIELLEATYPVGLLLAEMEARGCPPRCMAYYAGKPRRAQ